MRRIHHEFKCRIDDSSRLLRVEVLHQVHRSLDVGEQCSDRLALALGGLDLRRDSYRRRRLLVEDWCTALQGGACNLVLDHDTFEGCQGNRGDEHGCCAATSEGCTAVTQIATNTHASNESEHHDRLAAISQ